MLSFRLKLKLIGFAIGIFACYTTFGLLQEKIFRGRYGNETDIVDGKPGEKFRLPISFGLMQSIFYTSFAKSELDFFIWLQSTKSIYLCLPFQSSHFSY